MVLFSGFLIRGGNFGLCRGNSETIIVGKSDTLDGERVVVLVVGGGVVVDDVDVVVGNSSSFTSIKL